MRRSFAVFLCTALLFTCLTPSVCAARAAYRVEQLDVGNQNSYSGGDSDSGDGWSSSDSDSSIDSPLEFVIVIVVLIVYAATKGFKNSGRGGTSRSTRSVDTYRPEPTLPTFNHVGSLHDTDPYFSEQTFLTWAKEVFITLNDAWTRQDWKGIRVFESDELYNQHSRQLEDYVRKGQVNELERVAVKESVIERFYTEAEYEYLVVKMHATMIDYVKETATGRIVAGSTTTLWNMLYTLTFKRKKGLQSLKNLSELRVTNCPNCGAPTEITSSGVCPFCKSTITTGDYNWVLCDYVGQNL